MPMTFSQKQLKQIIYYDAERLYYGNWKAKTLDQMYHITEASDQPEPMSMYVGDLTNDIICNTLWYEMSYNPLRFGNVSPFKTLVDDKNDIVYFNTTYRKKLQQQTRQFLPNNIMDLTWNISNFVSCLHKTELYDDFVKTGKLPTHFDIYGPNHNFYLLSSLRKAIHAITKQNWEDLKDPLYKQQIITTVQHRHPKGYRSDVNYMFVQVAYNAKPDIKGSPESVENIKRIKNEIENIDKQKQRS